MANLKENNQITINIPSLPAQVFSELPSVDDWDVIGQANPEISSGHKSMAYALFMGLNFASNGAWAAVGMMFVPVTASLGLGLLTLSMLFRATKEENQKRASRKNTVTVESTEVCEEEYYEEEDNEVEIATVPVKATPQQWDEEDEEPETSADEKRLRDALGYPAVLIYGASGSGKSTLARWFIHERQQLGHSIEVCDPHRAYGQWEDVDHYGDGLDYQSCDDRLKAFSDRVNSRYRKLAGRPNYNPKPHTLLTEEFTNWAEHCPHSGSFFASSLSDLRKVNMNALYVAHGRTLSSLGGSSGKAKQRDNSLLEIELDVAIDKNGRPVPAGTGHIKYPQRSQKVPIRIPSCVSAFADGKKYQPEPTRIEPAKPPADAAK
ncbi:MAG: ATP-binding protein, partial [Leptolyngbya sp. SIO3F4]|nr:ATP-binding protein [Leptolyngbya sp. SIO3F4]